MTRLAAFALIALALVGCTGSDEPVATESTTSTTETTPPSDHNRPPRTYEELMARLPAFDEPASPEVVAWRKATIDASFGRCVSGGGADRATFVAANRSVLKEAVDFPEATFLSESSIGHRDGNGCPDGLGPPTYYTTDRTFELPAGTEPFDVFAHYEAELDVWLPLRISACEWRFAQGPGYVDVNACDARLRLTALGLAPVEIRRALRLPPRPYGAGYPAARDLVAPDPTPFEVDPGETCERIAGDDVPSIIIPPTPGIQAEIRGREVVVEWTLGTVHGDCPPSELVLTYRAVRTHVVHQPVHSRSGETRMALLDLVPRPTKLTAVAISVDGPRSRRVSVLIRR